MMPWASQRKEPRQYTTIAESPDRNREAAVHHNAEGLRLIELGIYDQAETELKLALEADLFYGPAHNNLGTVYLRREDYYRAAWEFQYAAKLMQGRAEPLYNLGMVFEEIGDLEKATERYEKALEISPEEVRIAGNLVRIYRHKNRKDQQTRQLLQQVVMQDARPDWRQWARQQLALIGQPDQTPATQPTDDAPADSLGAY